MEKSIKIILAILLLICLVKLPYGYYQIVRFIAFIGFGILAYLSYISKNKIFALVYGSLSLLFQPFYKIALGRDLWNIVDVIVGIVLIVTLFIEAKKGND